MLLESFLFIVTLPIASSLMCNKCTGDNTVNYMITANSVPPMPSNCTLVEGLHDCSIDIRWMKTPIQSSVSYGVNPTTVLSSYHHIFVSVDHRAPGYAAQQDVHVLTYICNTDGCNNDTAAKRILNAVTLTENLHELESLLASGPNPPFTEQASCFNFSNATTMEKCIPSGATSLSNCVACRTQMKSNVLCAQCAARFSIRVDDYILRSKVFFLNNGTQTENIELFCRVKDCNALSSVDQIREASTLEFDFEKFINGTLPSSSAHTFQSIHLHLMILINIFFFCSYFDE